ncbi:hypothetical protein F6R98_10255 [Candidatus Methylospira mobilis]|uniref:Morphogenetic protein n=1 Tax=Candidatus Methylospira mobilis TaxID=1808979 RepID=A0A5Q0BMJ0_9GAMM|nr:hypothetical protein [Candidatus Methylospira mobilis]QFY42946.1 hypothetical protein F6R98_10255 [Candidatus Methylospira mobilis]
MTKIERPIIFSGGMVRAILDGRKTQTRRVIKNQPDVQGWIDKPITYNSSFGTWRYPCGAGGNWKCPYGRKDDWLWVRETHAIVPSMAYARSAGVPITINHNDVDYAAIYQASFDRGAGGIRWHPSIHMPRWASRIVLEITGVRVERLQGISTEDVLAEGINRITHGREGDFYHATHTTPHPNNKCYAEDAYKELWESINGPGSWDKNPWVWVIEFKRIDP